MLRDSPNALHQYPEIAARLQGHEVAVFLDYDGTLTPIVSRPELAILDGQMRDTVERLSREYTIAIISGRACDDVRALVGIDGLHYAGNHGLEIEGPGGISLQRLGEEYREDIHRYSEQVGKLVAATDGVLIENKDLSLSVHYRLVAPGGVPDVEAAVDRLLKEFPRLEKRQGKKVFEIRPRIDWHKGKAVRWLLRALDVEDAMAIYIGDDQTDEDAFHALPGPGFGIRVGRAEMASGADYYLEDTDEVRRFLEMLISVARSA